MKRGSWLEKFKLNSICCWLESKSHTYSSCKLQTLERRQKANPIKLSAAKMKLISDIVLHGIGGPARNCRSRCWFSCFIRTFFRKVQFNSSSIWITIHCRQLHIAKPAYFPRKVVIKWSFLWALGSMLTCHCSERQLRKEERSTINFPPHPSLGWPNNCNERW